MKINDFINSSITPKFIFFAGKGGVGKSTMSCSTAIWAAKQGHKVLIVTTDPAPNLSDIFQQKIGDNITQINSFPNLFAIEIDPEIAAKNYREDASEYFSKLFSGNKLTAILEELKSPCVEEVATLNKFLSYMDKNDFDLIIFDTAPTGHTLRLLQLPGSWSMELSKGGYTCIGPNDTLQEEKKAYEKAVSIMTNESMTRFIFVVRPEILSLEETLRSIEELKNISITTDTIIVNGLLPTNIVDDPNISRMFDRQQELLIQIRKDFSTKELLEYELLSEEINGLGLLEATAEVLFEGKKKHIIIGESESEKTIYYPFTNEIEQLLIPKKSIRYLFYIGKGGVGKTTIASISALHLSKSGLKTLLVTTDPADHLKIIFKTKLGIEPVKVFNDVPLFVANIDSKITHAEYKERKLKEILDKINANPNIKANIEETKKKVLEELNSPCAEEVAYFEKFMSYFYMKDFEVIIFDTAPTGHTLRMLELPSEWSDYVESSIEGMTQSENKYGQIIDLMKNTELSSFVFVMYAEYTPMIEAWRAYQSLKEFTGIEAAFITINNILSEETTDAFINARIKQQNKYLKKIKELFQKPILMMPQLDFEPIGKEKLEQAEKILFKKDN